MFRRRTPSGSKNPIGSKLNKQKRGGIFQCRPAFVVIERYIICVMLHALKEMETGDKKTVVGRYGAAAVRRAKQSFLSFAEGGCRTPARQISARRYTAIYSRNIPLFPRPLYAIICLCLVQCAAGFVICPACSAAADLCACVFKVGGDNGAKKEGTDL